MEALAAGDVGLYMTTQELARDPPRDFEPQKMFLGPNKYSLQRFPMKNIPWAWVTFVGVGTARAGAGRGGPASADGRAGAAARGESQRF